VRRIIQAANPDSEALPVRRTLRPSGEPDTRMIDHHGRFCKADRPFVGCRRPAGNDSRAAV
jgi:hypothetical protein